jgi:tRNA-dependent cyclodipeptide synthase
MNPYKVTICKSPGWRKLDTCTLGVSVPSSNWQGERFASILGFAAIHFKRIRIDVTDELYRHNFMAKGLSSTDATARAHYLGTSWLERHQAVIEACPVAPEVIRWGQWYKHPDYVTILEQFSRTARNAPPLYEAIERDIEAFHQRFGRAATKAEHEHSRDFLLEELAVLTLQARELPGVRIYPGDQLASMQVVSHGLVPQAPRGLELEQFAEINLRSRRTIEAEATGFRSPVRGHPKSDRAPAQQPALL